MSQALNPGDRVEGLQIEQVLSVQDHAVNYLAVDPELGTRLLLRECLPAGHVVRSADGILGPSGPGAEEAFEHHVERFLAACRLAADIDHPAVVPVLRTFRARGTAWCLLRPEPGAPLAERLRSGAALSAEEMRALLQDLMGALAVLHERGAFHAWLRADNVQMTRSGRFQLLDVQPTAETRGEANAAAADIYALSALAYQAATGQAPAGLAMRREARERGLEDPVPALAGQQLARALGAMADAIDQGLRLDESERPDSVSRWRAALERIEWRQREAARDPEAASPEGREWLAPMLVGAVLAVLLATMLYLLFTPDRSPDPVAPGPGTTEPAVPAEETERWQAALRADTLLAYRRFLEDFPQSGHRTQAEIQVDILDRDAWRALSAENTREAYAAYLDQFPNGLSQSEAMRRIDDIDQATARAEREREERTRRDNAAWQAALEQRSAASMNAYLADWPAGLHVEDAQRLKRQLRDQELERQAWEAARKLDSQAAYQAYIDAYPNAEHSAEALIRLEHLDLSPGKVFRDCVHCPAMRVLPPGEFWQGSGDDASLARNDEKPRRLVDIAYPFAIGVMEVTFEEWDACVAGGGCSAQPTDNGWGRGNRPVILVSWNDAQAYTGWLSREAGQTYRLPSESEWEYAARAGEQSEWLGGSPMELCRFANIAGAETEFNWRSDACSDQWTLGTLPAGSLAGNGFGLHDVIGNVAEWTADCVNLSYLDAPVDGSAWGRGICSSHVTRGGSWVTGAEDVRLPARFALDNGDRNDFTGFRVVRVIEP